jgi:flagellar M-ring protein FliF
VPNATSNAKETVEGEETTQTTRSESNTYVVSKMTKHTLQPAGRIHRISAALVVDDAVDVKEQGGKRVEQRRKRTADEMKQIEALAMAAIGADTARGDVVAVQNISFRQPDSYEAPSKLPTTEKIRVLLTNWSMLVRYGAMLLLFLLVYFLVLRPVKKQVVSTFKELPAHVAAGQKPQSALPEADLTGQRSLLMKKQLVEKVKAEPASAGRLVQAWLREGGQ